jgi:hypothetical protein
MLDPRKVPTSLEPVCGILRDSIRMFTARPEGESPINPQIVSREAGRKKDILESKCRNR